MDRFRVREEIALRTWADEAQMPRSQFNKYRSGESEPRADALSRLVRAAGTILGRPVQASELFDVGEDVPVAHVLQPQSFRQNARLRKVYDSRLDQLLRQCDMPPNAFARVVRLSRRALQKLREEGRNAELRTIRQIVGELRRNGYDVCAADVVDLGEN